MENRNPEVVKSQGHVIGSVRWTQDQAWVATHDNGCEVAGFAYKWQATSAVRRMNTEHHPY